MAGCAKKQAVREPVRFAQFRFFTEFPLLLAELNRKYEHFLGKQVFANPNFSLLLPMALAVLHIPVSAWGAQNKKAVREPVWHSFDFH